MLPMWHSFTNQTIPEIPGDVALCVYDCERQDCTQEEWLTCERRSVRAADELPARARCSSRRFQPREPLKRKPRISDS
jgi:hypothetical protein